ncbi:hypothetical protein VNO77_43133 [Canavalia gladiata]|uniref:Uncharacterized protein n=1 Tax=Canavalia gladiata TaxID=3824 RepID=A0AAN9JVS9_CANGL
MLDISETEALPSEEGLNGNVEETASSSHTNTLQFMNDYDTLMLLREILAKFTFYPDAILKHRSRAFIHHNNGVIEALKNGYRNSYKL